MADTAAPVSPPAEAEHAREHVAVPAPPPSSPGGQSGFEAFKARVFREPALQGEVIPADFWLMKFYDGYAEDALDALIRTVQWRKEYGYYILKDEGTKFADDVASEKLIYYAYDKTGCPILLWRVALHVADAKQIEHTVRFVVWQIERGIRLGLIKDRVSFFLDRAGSSTKNVESAAFFKYLISILQTHFPELLHRMVLFPSNLVLQTVWKVVKPFLDVTVVQKVVMFTPKEYHAGLLSLVDKEQLLTEHGGKGAKRFPGDLVVEIPAPNGEMTPVVAASAESEGDDVGTATIVAGPDEESTPAVADSEVDDVGITTIVADSEWPDEEATPVDAADCNVKVERPSSVSAGSLTDDDSDVGLLSIAPDTAGAAAATAEPKSKTAAVDTLFAHLHTASAAAPEPKAKSAAIEALSAVRDAAAAVGSGPKAKTASKFRFWRKKSGVE